MTETKTETYFCDDGNARLEITAESAEAAAAQYVSDGNWGPITRTTWIHVYVWQHQPCAACGGTGRSVPECSYCVEPSTGTDDDGDPVCVACTAENYVQTIGPAPELEVCPKCEGAGVVDGPRASHRIDLDPPEPECLAGHVHDWSSPWSVLGGDRANPGVWGNGGGVIIKEVCAHCAAYRETDTWAQDMTNGEQGLTTVEYHEADSDSQAWVSGSTK